MGVRGQGTRHAAWWRAAAAGWGLLLVALLASPAAWPAEGESLPAARLPLVTAGYLGTGLGADRQQAVAIAPDGSILVAGRVAADGLRGAYAMPLLGGGTGTVVRLSSDGRQVLSATRIGQEVSDLAVAPDGGAVIVGDFGVAVLHPDGKTLRWRAPLDPPAVPTVRRVDVDEQGRVGVVSGNVVSTFSPSGQPLGEWPVSGTVLQDIVMHGPSDSVIVTGYQQRRLLDGRSVEVALIESSDLSGRLRWRDYGFEDAVLARLPASTRGLRLALGEDGLLYFLGQSQGYRSVFTRDPQDHRRTLQLVAPDPYHRPDPYGSGPALFYARLAPYSGEVLAAQSAHLGGREAALVGQAIAADELGQIYLAGVAGCCIPARNRAVLGGSPVTPFQGQDVFVMVVSGDLRQRLTWVPLGGVGTVGGIAVHQRLVALAGTMIRPGAATAVPAAGQPAVSARPASSIAPQAPDGFIAVWPSPRPRPAPATGQPSPSSRVEDRFLSGQMRGATSGELAAQAQAQRSRRVAIASLPYLPLALLLLALLLSGIVISQRISKHAG